jgi:hypothetical protein
MKAIRHAVARLVTRWLAVPLCATVMLASVPAHGMEFAFRPVTIETDTQTWLVASGEIRSGDAKRLRQFLVNNYTKWALGGPNGGKAALLLNSPGGDVEEAIQLAQVLREAFVTAAVMPPVVCASACFFLYVGAAKRLAASRPGGGLAIHRPYFPAEVARQMSAKRAQVANSAAYAKAKRWLQDQLVPQVLIDRMFSLSSTQAYWLTNTDIFCCWISSTVV